MKIVIEKEKLIKCLSIVQGIVERKTVMPILENVLFEVGNGKIQFSATDLEVGIQGSFEVEVVEEGKVAILAKKTLEIVRELKEKKIKMEQKESHTGGKYVEIISGKTAFHVLCADTEEYPLIPKDEEIDLFSVHLLTLKDMIKKTIFAASDDEKRYSLNGVFFDVEEKIMRMVATDGYRLSMIERENEGKGTTKSFKGLIIPKKGLGVFKNILELDKENDSVQIGKKGNNLICKVGEISTVMRLIEGEFPDYKILIPEGNIKKILVKRSEFLGALKRVSQISGERIKPVKFFITDNKIEITASSQEYGEAYDEIRIEYKDEDIRVGFNSGYFMEALNIIETEEVWLEIKDFETSAILRPSNDNKQLCAIMPMRL